MFSILTNSINRKKNKKKVYPKCDNILYINSCHANETIFDIPNHAGIGAVLNNNYKEIWGYCRYIGNDITQCEAEYYALIIGLEKVLEDNIMILSVCGNNQDVINQINNVNKIESKLLLPLYEKVNKIKTKFKYIDFTYICKEENKRAIELSNIAIHKLNPFSF